MSRGAFPYWTLHREQALPGTPADVFPFFADAHNLEAITPPFLRFEVLTPRPIEMRVGTIIEYRLSYRGLPVRWLTRIEEWVPGERFVDQQLSGPYKLWHHTHTFRPDPADPSRTLMTDTVRYAVNGGPLSYVLNAAFVGRDVEAIFDFRRTAIEPLLPGAAPQPAGAVA